MNMWQNINVRNPEMFSGTQVSFLPFFLKGNNDDVILSCCLHYCKDKAKDFMPNEKST